MYKRLPLQSMTSALNAMNISPSRLNPRSSEPVSPRTPERSPKKRSVFTSPKKPLPGTPNVHAVRTGADGRVQMVNENGDPLDLTPLKDDIYIVRSPKGSKAIVKRMAPTELALNEWLKSHAGSAREASPVVLPRQVVEEKTGADETNYWAVLPEGQPFVPYVMDRLAKCGDDHELKAAFLLNMLGQALESLRPIHKADRSHRDVKGDNFLVGYGGHVRSIDFESIQESGKPDSEVGRTYGFIPPEVREGVVDPKSDLWSLGVVMIEFAIGKSHHEMLQALEITELPEDMVDEYGDLDFFMMMMDGEFSAGNVGPYLAYLEHFRNPELEAAVLKTVTDARLGEAYNSFLELVCTDMLRVDPTDRKSPDDLYRHVSDLYEALPADIKQRVRELRYAG